MFVSVLDPLNYYEDNTVTEACGCGQSCEMFERLIASTILLTGRPGLTDRLWLSVGDSESYDGQSFLSPIYATAVCLVSVLLLGCILGRSCDICVRWRFKNHFKRRCKVKFLKLIPPRAILAEYYGSYSGTSGL